MQRSKQKTSWQASSKGRSLWLRPTVLLLSTAVLFGCDFGRNQEVCESIDWYAEGQKAGEKAEDVNSLMQVHLCQKSKYEVPFDQLYRGFMVGLDSYCSEETATKYGEKGDLYPITLCRAAEKENLSEVYQKSLGPFCQTSRAFVYGISGEIYKKVCLVNGLDEFEPIYKLGRIHYLMDKIEDSDRKLAKSEKIEGKLVQISRPKDVPETIKIKEGQAFEVTNEEYKDYQEKRFKQIQSVVFKSPNEKEKLIMLRHQYYDELNTLRESVKGPEAPKN